VAKLGVWLGVERGMERLGMSRSFSSSFGLIMAAVVGGWNLRLVDRKGLDG